MNIKESAPTVLAVLGAVVLLFLSYLVTSSVSVPIDSIADLTNLGNITVWVGLLVISFAALLGIYLLSRTDKKLHMIIMIALFLLAMVTLNLSEMDTLLFLSLLMGGLIITDEPWNVKGLWKVVRSIKSHSGLVFLLLITVLTVTNAVYFNDMVLKGLVSTVNQYVPEGGSLTPLVDQLITTEVTPQELNTVLSYLQSLPEWELLTPQQRQQLIEEAKAQLSNQKAVIKDVLKQSLSNVNLKLDVDTVKMLLSASPKLRALYDYLFVFLILGAAAVVSIVLEISSLLVFLVLLLPVWIADRGKPNKEEPCK